MTKRVTPGWMITEFSRRLRAASAFASRMPPVIRRRRRGYRPGVKRGDYVLHNEQTYCVVRRSRWHLWLEEVRDPLKVGDTIQVRVPTRFQGQLG